MELKGIDIVEPSVTEVTIGMIEHYFSSLADVSLLEMHQQLSLRKQLLLIR